MDNNHVDRDNGRRDWLAALLLRQPDRFMPRLAAAVMRWQSLSRGFRRRFTRKVAATTAGAALVLAMAGSPLLVPRAHAATITVDGVTCTLIDAIRAANTNAAAGGCVSGAVGQDTIDLQADTLLGASYSDVYGSPTGLPAITEDLIIEGNGFTIERDGTASAFRVLAVGDGATVTINDTTITGGLSHDLGGGIHVAEGGDLTLNDSFVTGNRAGLDTDPDNYAFERGDGGGIYVAGSLTLNNTEVSDNTAMAEYCFYGFGCYSIGRGGGIFNEEGTVNINNSTISGNYSYFDGGGLFDQSGAVTITGSVFRENEARADAGGLYKNGDLAPMIITGSTFEYNETGDKGGGIYLDNGAMTITDSTISHNTSANDGGGIFGFDNDDNYLKLVGSTISNNYGYEGGGLYLGGGEVTIVNSTISGNEARDGQGGGIYNDAAALTVINTTVTGNTALQTGGGLFQRNFSGASLTFIRSIFSGNTAGNNYDEIDILNGTVTADAYNVFSHDGLATVDALYGITPGTSDFNASSDANNVALADILDTTLAGNGGPTLTHNLVLGSPALDIAPDADCEAPSLTDGVDQRGFVRPFDVPGQGNEGADTCDAGAVEYGSAAPSEAVFMSTRTAGTTGDGLDFGSEDIIQWDGSAWSTWFDGSAAGLTPTGKARHNINALWIPDPDGNDLFISFAQNRRTVPGVGPKVDGMDIVVWGGAWFSFWFDGSDVGLTNKTQEKIDGLHVLPGSESPIGAGCVSYLLVSTQGPGKVPNYSGGQLKFGGEDVLGFCATSLGEDTAGLWHMVLDGSAEGMPRNSTDSISFSDDGQTMYLTTQGAFAVDAAAGGHSMVYEYDFGTGTFSGPVFSAPAEGLPEKVDGLQMN